MANHMETYVRITNGDINVANKLKEIFTPDEGKYEVWTTELMITGTGRDSQQR